MSIDYKEIIMKYRTALLEKGKAANFENPDKLDFHEMMALTEKVFSEVNNIDCSMGYPYHDTGLRRPSSISEEEQHQLFMDFVDWYQIVKTPSQDILDYVSENYPVDKFPKILCVGDGKNCHLGRKLAMKGYLVHCVDPLSRKVFTGRVKRENGEDAGAVIVFPTKFSKNSKELIDWASVIVGCKVPECVEDLVQIDTKPTVFNISSNPEIYHMKFKGIPITSREQFISLIKKCSGVQVKQGKSNEKGEEAIFFVRDEREIIKE